MAVNMCTSLASRTSAGMAANRCTFSGLKGFPWNGRQHLHGHWPQEFPIEWPLTCEREEQERRQSAGRSTWLSTFDVSAPTGGLQWHRASRIMSDCISEDVAAVGGSGGMADMSWLTCSRGGARLAPRAGRNPVLAMCSGRGTRRGSSARALSASSFRECM